MTSQVSPVQDLLHENGDSSESHRVCSANRPKPALPQGSLACNACPPLLAGLWGGLRERQERRFVAGTAGRGYAVPMGSTNSDSIYSAVVARKGLSPTHLATLALIPSNVSVLELGPASGYMTRELAERGCTIDAIELDPADAARARPFCRTLVVGSAEDPSSYVELTGPYRVVLMADVLEHLKSPERTLEHVRSRLSADGIAIVSLPNIAHWKVRLDLLRGDFHYKDSGVLDRTHLRFYTRETAEALFRAHGFDLVDVTIPAQRGRRLRLAKTWVRERWPGLFARQIIYRLRAAS